jgi:MFS family permease
LFAGINVIPTTYTFAIGRFGVGIVMGLVLLVVPVHLAEISPDKIRGKITLLFGISLTVGELMALIFGLPFAYGVSDDYWMIMFAFPALFSLIQALAQVFFFKHEPASWLIEVNRMKEAEAAIAFIYHTEYVKTELERLTKFETPDMMSLSNSNADTASEIGREPAEPSYSQLLCTRRYRKIATIAIMLQIYNCLSGVTNIYSYSNRMLEQEGLGKAEASLISVGIAAWNMAGVFIGIPFIDGYGRRPLLLVGALGMALSEVALGVFSFLSFNVIFEVGCILLCFAFYNISLGPVGWVYSSDIMGLHGIVIASFANWVTLAIIHVLFPFEIDPDSLRVSGTFWV